MARALCLAGAAAAGVPAIDTVFVDFHDSEAFRRECEAARRDGFSGKMAIHPAQVPIINEVFTPTPEAIAHAQAIVDAFAANLTPASSASAASWPISRTSPAPDACCNGRNSNEALLLTNPGRTLDLGANGAGISLAVRWLR